MSTAERRTVMERHDTHNRVRAIVRLTTGAEQEFSDEWRHSSADRSVYYDTAGRADRLVKSIQASKAAKVTWPGLGIGIASIRVFIDERNAWTERHETTVAKLHATHAIGGAS